MQYHVFRFNNNTDFAAWRNKQRTPKPTWTPIADTDLEITTKPKLVADVFANSTTIPADVAHTLRPAITTTETVTSNNITNDVHHLDIDEALELLKFEISSKHSDGPRRAPDYYKACELLYFWCVYYDNGDLTAAALNPPMYAIVATHNN